MSMTSKPGPGLPEGGPEPLPPRQGHGWLAVLIAVAVLGGLVILFLPSFLGHPPHQPISRLYP